MIDQEKIVQFVEAVETEKGFVRNHSLILRHMLSELAELDRALYETVDRRGGAIRQYEIGRVADECLDLIFLACYMASIFGLNLNQNLRPRMKAIAKRYGVRINIPGICSECFCSDESPCVVGCSWANQEQTLCTLCDVADDKKVGRKKSVKKGSKKNRS